MSGELFQEQPIIRKGRVRVVERPVDFPEAVGAKCAYHIENAVKPEGRSGGDRSLEGEYPKPAKTPRVIHYTNGGPWFEQWRGCDYADLWIRERDLYLQSPDAAEARESA